MEPTPDIIVCELNQHGDDQHVQHLSYYRKLTYRKVLAVFIYSQVAEPVEVNAVCRFTDMRVIRSQAIIIIHCVQSP